VNLSKLKRRAKEYVEIEAKCKVRDVRFAESFSLLGREDVVLSVSTDDAEVPEWWVVGGDSPMNLYDKARFSNPDCQVRVHLSEGGLWKSGGCDDCNRRAA